jgi:hypothetical protein
MAFPRKLLSVTTTDFVQIALADGGTVQALPVDGSSFIESSGPVLVFRPGDPLGNHSNVFVDFASLMTARALLNGPVWVEVDGTLGTPTVPPSGGAPWNFDDLTFTARGPVGGLPIVLFFAQGAQVTYETLRLQGAVKFRNQSTLPVCVQTNVGNVLYIGDTSSIFVTTADVGAAPWLQVSVFSRLLLTGEGIIGASAPTITVDAGQTLFSSSNDQSNVFAGSIVGAGNFIANQSADARIGAQTVASVAISLQDLASLVSYVPTTPGNWTSPVPSVSQAALDQLAARALVTSGNAQLPFPVPFTPGGGKILLVVDITPQTTGLLLALIPITVSCSGVDIPEFQLQWVDLLTAITGGVSGGTGITLEPTSVTGAAPVTVAQMNTNTNSLADSGQFTASMTLAVPVHAIAGHRTGIVVLAASFNGTNWNPIFGNVTVREL